MCALLAVGALSNGLPAGLTPHRFWAEFPSGRGWVAATGPYNEHTTRDFGVFALALGVLLAWAALRPQLELIRAALVAALVANVPHTVYHLAHPEQLPPADATAVGLLLGIPAAVNLVAAVVAFRRPAPSRAS